MFVRGKSLSDFQSELLEMLESNTITDAEKIAIVNSYANHASVLNVLCREPKLRIFFHDIKYNADLMKLYTKMLRGRLGYPDIKVDSETSQNGKDLLKTIVAQIDKATSKDVPESEALDAVVYAVKNIIKLPQIIIYKFMQNAKFKLFCTMCEPLNKGISDHFLKPVGLIHFEIHGSNGKKLSCIDQYVAQYFLSAYHQLTFVRNLESPDADCLLLLGKACEFGSCSAYGLRIEHALDEEKSTDFNIEAATAELANLFGAYGHVRAGWFLQAYTKLQLASGKVDEAKDTIQLAAKHYLCGLFLADELASKKILKVIKGSDTIQSCFDKSGIQFSSPAKAEEFIQKMLGGNKETYLFLYKKAMEEVARRGAELSKDSNLDDEKTMTPSN